MKNFTKILFAAMLLVSFVATAQDEEKSSPLTISGSVDTYFRANINSANDGSGSTPGSSFGNGNGFSLGMANIIVGMEGEKTGFVADLVYGPRGNEAVFASFDDDGVPNGSSPLVNQLYVYWNVSDKTTLTFGNFNTFLGYEVISPSANFNYSTSYMFSYGPFSHTGLKADFSLSDDLSLMLGVFNPTDFTEMNPANTYSFGAQLGYKGVYLNLLYGDQTGTGDAVNALFQADLTAGWDLTDEFYLGINATYQSTKIAVDGVDPAGFYGAAIYAQYGVSDAFAIGARVEYFSQFGYFDAIGIDYTAFTDAQGEGSVIDLTLSAPYSVGPLTIIPEVRIDLASEDIYGNVEGDDVQSNLASFVLAAVYTF